jgi:hypothetical protein
MHAQLIFVLLQAADLATTLLAIRFGGIEQNPFVSHFMVLGTLEGLLFSKVVILTVAVAAVMARRARALKVANLFYAVVVLWNVSIICRLTLWRSV